VEWLARWMVAVHYRHHLTSTNVCFDPTQEAMLRRSEGPQSALHVEMYMPQHRSLQGLCRRSVRLAPISAPAQFLLPPPKKIHAVIPPPKPPHWEAGRGCCCDGGVGNAQNRTFVVDGFIVRSESVGKSTWRCTCSCAI
jgi:hypothetical protein